MAQRLRVRNVTSELRSAGEEMVMIGGSKVNRVAYLQVRFTEISSGISRGEDGIDHDGLITSHELASISAKQLEQHRWLSDVEVSVLMLENLKVDQPE